MPIFFVALLLGGLAASSALAADGEIIITHASALAGGVTPGDAPGYPVTISRGGSYKLGSNLQAPPGKNGVDVNAVEVTIDLNGFRINGDKTGSVNTGIRGFQRNLRVRNGTVRNFKAQGVMAGHGLIVEDMNVSENGGTGIYFDAGSGYGRVVNSTIMQNGNMGIYCGMSCHIEGNIVSANANGVKIETSATILGNMISNNSAAGLVIGGGFAGGAKTVGVGNNAIFDNAAQITGGAYKNLHPNACAPQACP